MEKAERVKELRQKGLTFREIQKKMNFSSSSQVSFWLKKSSFEDYGKDHIKLKERIFELETENSKLKGKLKRMNEALAFLVDSE